ncbi:MAG: alpha/beta hydrolase [Solobacterium sp.]|nr:alpha/beta hydrolase [Solobacterium sp.]
MLEKTFRTLSGIIHYWTNDIRSDRRTLVFLPGLTADHRLFDKQTEAFEDDFNLLSWDAPGHAASRPFELNFSLMDKAEWLHKILVKENIQHPVLVGQSMGGYVSQCFMQKYPGETAGFISIDSAPLKRCYVTAAEIWLLKRTGPMFKAIPWKLMRKTGIEGVSKTEYGRSLMALFIDSYTKEEYYLLADNGYRLLAEAMEADLPYVIDCPAVLICGEKDEAGSAKSYNRRWADKENLPILWIKNAGHNANTDQPEEVNRIILDFVRLLKE